MPLFDTHAHLADEQLCDQVESWLQIASQAGLVGINSVGTDRASSINCYNLAQRYALVFASVGIHPNYCQNASLDDWPVICELAQHRQVVAIGETGLDRYWDYCPIEIQYQWFARHIELSYQVKKPLVIHMRECEQDVVTCLAEHRQGETVQGILHSFGASWETARQCLEWGMYISFSGSVTYKKSEQLREIAARVPNDRILIETDAPYLAPEPVRGTRPNHPGLIHHTAARLAKLKQMELSDFCELTTANARRALGLAESS
jgi:TatD DNase family protein